jgi:hypothetical protein
MHNFTIVSVPDAAEFYKYWIVKSIGEHSFEYHAGFLTKEDALEAFAQCDDSMKLLSNDGSTRKLVNE